MPSLTQSLSQADLSFLRIIASLWGIDLHSPAPAAALEELTEAMLDAELMEEVISALPPAAEQALSALLAEGGKMRWVAFARQFGDLREMGAARRDREQPHVRPNSAAETLYYRALLAKAFFETDSGPQEFAYIPEDLLQALEFIGFEARPSAAMSEDVEAEEEEEAVSPPPPAPLLREEPAYEDFSESGYEEAEVTEAASRPVAPPRPAPAAESRLGRAASPAEKAFPQSASDQILDDATTCLAALRMGLEIPRLSVPAPILLGVLTAARLLDAELRLAPEAVKAFLEMPRPRALMFLVEAWQGSPAFNELRQLPGLTFEGGWQNQPLVTREFLLDLLAPIPEGQWWSLNALVRDVKARYADFQRPAGDYDSWFIKREADGQFLRGFAHWDEVDGALVRYLVTGPLFWLAQVDLARSREEGEVTAFRLVAALAQGEESGKAQAFSEGRVVVERSFPRAARYQIARFCDWEEEKPGEYRYRVTPQSLSRAAGQGLKASHLLSLLAKHGGGQVPPVLVKALQRWEAKGSEAKIETLTALKVSRPEVLDELRKSKAARFLGEPLGPTSVVIAPDAAPKLLAALAELGLLAEVVTSSPVLPPGGQ